MVTIKNAEGNDIALASGVEAGEMVVLEGMDKIQDGERVDVQTPGQPTDTAGGTRNGQNGGRGRGRGRNQGNGQ
jgi:multidrug efflux system membrane fusion protein